jgi:hypothetical protein
MMWRWATTKGAANIAVDEAYVTLQAEAGAAALLRKRHRRPFEMPLVDQRRILLTIDGMG